MRKRMSPGSSSKGAEAAEPVQYTTTSIPAFLSKLWTLVEDPKYDPLIAWDASGFSFHVFDQTRFAKEILPRFFKHNNMASFIRQLNMYGFRKVNSIDHGSLRNEKEDLEFHHPYFIRGKEQFLEFIKRKVPDGKPGSAAPGPASTELSPTMTTGAATSLLAPASQQPAIVELDSIKPEALNKVLDDVNSLKSRQKNVDDSLMDVKKENEVLWKEIATLRQKHHQQQQIVNKLIHFLVHLVNPSSLGIKRNRPLMIDSHHTAKSLAGVGVNLLDGELSDGDNSGPAAGLNGINEIDDDDEEEFLSAPHGQVSFNDGSPSLDSLGQPPLKKSKLNSAYVVPAVGRQPDLKNIHHASTGIGGLKSAAGYESTGGNGGVYTTANQGGVVINEIIDSPVAAASSLLGYEPSKETNASVNSAPMNSDVGNGDDFDPTLFLNANQSQEGPIITAPASPLAEQDKQQQQTPSELAIAATDAAATLPGAPVFKRTLSNQQMSDHVEELQLDLNSIKEFLSSNNFNQIDPFTISNLFSPQDFGSADNEHFYLEQPLGAPAAVSDDRLNIMDSILATPLIEDRDTAAE